MCHGNRAAAEDAVAETFIKVFNTWSTGGVNNFFGYARQTLLNYVLGQYRHEQVVARHLNAQSGDLRGQRDAVDDVVDGSATFELLQELPPRQRAAIVLRFYEDLPYDQIAQTLGVTVGTVKAQVSVGLQKLRTIMETAQ